MFMTKRGEPHTLRAADYSRISDDKKAGTDEERRGVLRQREGNKARIQAGGWQHVCTLEDNDLSATSTRKARPGFTELLRMVRAGEVDVVVAWHFDRLCRRPIEAAALFDAMAKANCLLVISQGGELDMGSAIGRMVAEILAVVARMEVALKAERQMLSNQQRRAEGRASKGGRAPLGYTAGLELIVEEEAALIRAAYAHILAGGSVRSIAKDWEKRGIASRFRKGKPYTEVGIRTILAHPRNAGILTYDGVEIGPGTWESIVSEEDFREAQLVLANPDRLNHSGAGRKHLLSGLIYCGVCAAEDGEDRLLTSGAVSRRGGSTRLYQCRPTEHVSRVAEPIEAIVLEAVWRRLAQRDAVQLLVRPERTNVTMLRARANKLRRGRANVLDLVADCTYSKAEASTRVAKIDAELKEIEATIFDSPMVPTLESLIQAAEEAGKSMRARAEAVEAAWDRMDLTQRQAAVKLLVKVTVSRGRPGRKFDLGSVAIEYLV